MKWGTYGYPSFHLMPGSCLWCSIGASDISLHGILHRGPCRRLCCTRGVCIYACIPFSLLLSWWWTPGLESRRALLRFWRWISPCRRLHANPERFLTPWLSPRQCRCRAEPHRRHHTLGYVPALLRRSLLCLWHCHVFLAIILIRVRVTYEIERGRNVALHHSTLDLEGIK